MRSRTKIRSCATILGLLYILLLDPAFVTTAPVSVEEGDFDVEGGCYYMLELYQNGEQIRTNEPCLNCTCSDNMLMCYLKTCPFTKPIGSDCKAERIPGMCCPIIKCPEVPVMIPESHHQVAGTTAVSVAHYPTTTALSVAKPEEGGCYSNEKYYGEGSQVPSSSTADPCDLCYCIQNHTACVKQRCVLEIPGCTPKYREGVCCPVGYNCDSSVTFTSTSTTTTTTTTTTTLPSTGCWVDDEFYYDGSNIITGEACNHCYCLQGKVVCAVQECDPPVEWCQPVITHDSCCPFKYNCSSTIRPPLNASYDEAFSTTPEVHADDDVVETSTPEILILDSTTVPPNDEKSNVDEEKPTTSAPGDESEHPSIATTESYSEDEIKLTTEQEIEPNVVLDQRFKKPIVPLDVPHPTPAVLSDEIETVATSAAPKEEELPVTTEQVFVAETTESFKEEVKVQADEQPTVRPLESDSHRVEPEATTELFETTATVEKIDNVQAIEALKPVDTQTTQLPVKDLEIEKQPEATTNLNLDDDVANPTTAAAPESINLEATTELFVKEADEKEPEVHLTESKLSTPEIELATTEEHFPQETTAAAVADDESKLDTTPAVVEDEESNLIEERVKPTAKPTHVIESKPEKEATTAVPVLPTADLLAENRDELTETPIAFTTEIVQNNPEEIEKFTTELPPSILSNEPAATTEASNLNVETTALPVEVKEELTTQVPLEHSGDDDAILSDPIPGEGDCLRDGVTYSSDSAVPSNNLCLENCTCHNSIIKCDKIQCEKPASFRHLTCTEVFEDKHCCPRYVCESTSNRTGGLESDSLVTEDSPVFENAEKATSAPLEQTTVFEEKLTTERFLESEEKVSTFVPEAPVEAENEITTAVPVADDDSEVDKHKTNEPIEPTTEEVEPQQIDDHQTNKPIEPTTEVPEIEPATEVPEIEPAHDEQIVTTEAVELKEPELTTFKEEATTVKEHKIEIITTPKLEVIETTVAPLDDSPPLALTTEAVIVKESVDDVVTAADDVEITPKPHDLFETKFVPTEEPLQVEEEITTVGVEKIETEAPSVETAAPHVPAETVAPVVDEVFATTEFLEVSSPPPLKHEKPIIADDQSPIHEVEHLLTTSAEVLIPEIEATTENIPAVDAVTVTIPAVEAKTENIPAVEAATVTIPAVEAKTENIPAVEATTENIPDVEATTENIPAVEEKQAESTEKVLSIPQQNASIAHEVSFVTEENVQGDIQGEAHIAPSEKPTTSEKPPRENPTTRLSISVEVVTPEAIATTEVLPPVPVEEIQQQVNLTKEALEPPTEEPPKSFVQQDAKTEEPPVESIEFTSPLSVTETLVEDDDPLQQTVDVIPVTSTLPPKIDDRINEVVATTILPVKHTTTSTTAKVEEKHTTPVFVQPELSVTTAVPEEAAAAVTTSKLIADSHIFEHAETTTVKDVTYINVTTPAVELATEQHIKEYTTAALLQHPTTIPALVETVATTSVPVVITSHIPSKPITTTTTTEPTTSTTEKTTTVSSTLASTTTTTPIPSLSQHLPADEKEGVEDPHHSSHEVDYEDHTEGIFLPELGKPITAENFELQDGQCVYESRLYESAQQIPRSDPCDFCFCFRGDIICLQQSCPPPIDGCYEETIPGFCCPRFECPVTAVTLNVSDAKVPYPISASRQRSARAVAQIQVVVCEFRNKFYRPGELIKAASSPCMDCQCAESGTMKCTPKKCQLDPFWHSLHGFKKTDKIDIKRAGRIRH